LNTPTSHINKREQINRVEITKSRGNARRWRVRTTNTHRRNIVAFINGPIFEDGVFVMPVSLLVPVAHGAKLFVRSRHRGERLFLRYGKSRTFRYRCRSLRERIAHLSIERVSPEGRKVAMTTRYTSSSSLFVDRLFGNTGHCAACSKVIPAFEMVMRARTNVYHLECFACQQCNHR